MSKNSSIDNIKSELKVLRTLDIPEVLDVLHTGLKKASSSLAIKKSKSSVALKTIFEIVRDNSSGVVAITDPKALNMLTCVREISLGKLSGGLDSKYDLEKTFDTLYDKSIDAYEAQCNGRSLSLCGVGTDFLTRLSYGIPSELDEIGNFAFKKETEYLFYKDRSFDSNADEKKEGADFYIKDIAYVDKLYFAGKIGYYNREGEFKPCGEEFCEYYNSIPQDRRDSMENSVVLEKFLLKKWKELGSNTLFGIRMNNSKKEYKFNVDQTSYLTFKDEKFCLIKNRSLEILVAETLTTSLKTLLQDFMDSYPDTNSADSFATLYNFVEYYKLKKKPTNTDKTQYSGLEDQNQLVDRLAKRELPSKEELEELMGQFVADVTKDAEDRVSKILKDSVTFIIEMNDSYDLARIKSLKRRRQRAEGLKLFSIQNQPWDILEDKGAFDFDMGFDIEPNENQNCNENDNTLNHDEKRLVLKSPQALILRSQSVKDSGAHFVIKNKNGVRNYLKKQGYGLNALESFNPEHRESPPSEWFNPHCPIDCRKVVAPVVNSSDGTKEYDFSTLYKFSKSDKHVVGKESSSMLEKLIARGSYFFLDKAERKVLETKGSIGHAELIQLEKALKDKLLNSNQEEKKIRHVLKEINVVSEIVGEEINFLTDSYRKTLVTQKEVDERLRRGNAMEVDDEEECLPSTIVSNELSVSNGKDPFGGCVIL